MESLFPDAAYRSKKVYIEWRRAKSRRRTCLDKLDYWKYEAAFTKGANRKLVCEAKQRHWESEAEIALNTVERASKRLSEIAREARL